MRAEDDWLGLELLSTRMRLVMYCIVRLQGAFVL